MTGPLVELRDVYRMHRTSEGDAAALQGTTLELDHGEVLCVLGPSGAGKSTLLRVIAGQETPSAGVVRLLGQDIGRLGGRARARLRHAQIGFLGQSPDAAVSPAQRVTDAVGLPLALRGVGRRARQARISELLDAASLGDRARACAADLSGGERQRVALCAAIAHRPALLLADEPTGELDAANAVAIRSLIGSLTLGQGHGHGHGTSVIVVSHDLETAAIADRTVRMRDGRIVEDQRNGEDALVVDRGGWLRLSPRLLAEAGIDTRVQVHPVTGGLMLTPATRRRPAASAPEIAAPSDPHSRVEWEPARVAARTLGLSRGRGPSRRQVLTDLSLDFAPARLTAITGRSGVGKTTLLRLLCGLSEPDTGEVLIDDVTLTGRQPERLAALRRERIGYLPQEPAPVGFLSAEENVILSLMLRGWDADAAAQRTASVLAALGLGERSRQRVSRLSAGESQRVALARAVACARGLLVVDEPTSRLDRANAATVATLLAEAAIRDGQTVICATHDPELIRRADELVALARSDTDAADPAP